MAILDEQAGQAALEGGVTEQASTIPRKPERVFVAGGPLSTFIKQASKVSPRAVTRGTDAGDMAVPTAIEERQVPAGEYSKRQEALAEKVLSEEGRERFETAGGSAKTATELPPEGLTPEDIGMPPESQMPTRGEVKAEQVRELGQKGLSEYSTGVAPEGEAIDLLEMYKNRGVIIETDTGIDFNFDYMDDNEDIQSVLNAVSEILADPTEAVKRGIIKNEQTLQNASEKLADDLGFSRSVLKKKVGETLNAEEMTALRILLQRSAKQLAEMAEKITAGGADDAATLVAFRRKMAVHSALQMKAKGFQTEIARALQAFKIPVGPNVDVGYATSEILEGAGGQKLNRDMAKAYLRELRRNGQKGANKFVSKGWTAKTKRVLHEIYVNGLLSWPTTSLKNFLGTPLFAVYNEIADITGAGIGAGVRAGQRAMGKATDPEGIYLEDIMARWYGYGRSFKDAYLVGLETFKTGQQASVSGGKLDLDPTELRAIDSQTLGASGWMGQSIDFIGKVIRLPGDILGATDDFWKSILSRGALYEESMRQVRISKAAGKSDQEALDDGMMVLIDPRSRTEEISDFAKYNTLTADINNGVGSITRAIQKTFLGRFLLPFGKVPTNSIRILTENHPVAVFFSPSTQKRLLGKEGPKMQQRAMGRLAMGTGTMMTFMEYAQNGQMTGAMPTDKELKARLPNGWQPFSFVFRGDGWPKDDDGNELPMYDQNGIPNGPLVYISYQGLEPVSAFLGIAADTVQKMNMYTDPQDRENLLTASLGATLDYFKETPFLTSVGDIIKSMEYGDISLVIKSPLSNFTGPIPTPYSSVLRNVSKLQDPTITKVSPEVNYWTESDLKDWHQQQKDEGFIPKDSPFPYNMVGSIKGGGESAGEFWQRQYNDAWALQTLNNPFFQEAEKRYQKVLDPFGKPFMRNVPFSLNPVEATYNAIVPFKIKRGEAPTNVQREMLRLNMPLTNQPATIDGFKIPAYMGTDVALLAKNGEILVKGQSFEDALKSLVEVSVGYSRSRDDEKAAKVQKLEREFYEQAFKEIIARPENRDVLKAYMQRDTAQEILKSQKYTGRQ